MRGRKGEYRKELADCEEGFSASRSTAPSRNPDARRKKYKHDIDVVVDRIVVRPDIATRLADSFETALNLADGIAIVEFADRPLRQDTSEDKKRNGRSRKADDDEPSDILRNKNETHERITFSARFACPVSGFTIEEIEPRLFSFNAPAGACPKCDGSARS